MPCGIIPLQNAVGGLFRAVNLSTKWTLQAFRTGSNIRFIAVVREIAHTMGTEKSAVLPLFHTFTVVIQ